MASRSRRSTSSRSWRVPTSWRGLRREDGHGHRRRRLLSVPDVRVAKAPQDEAFLGPHGFVGDRHEAEFRKIARRFRASPQPSPVVRRLDGRSRCSSARDLGVDPPFALGALGENLRLSGVKLADVPEGSVLELPSGREAASFRAATTPVSTPRKSCRRHTARRRPALREAGLRPPRHPRDGARDRPRAARRQSDDSAAGRGGV